MVSGAITDITIFLQGLFFRYHQYSHQGVEQAKTRALAYILTSNSNKCKLSTCIQQTALLLQIKKQFSQGSSMNYRLRHAQEHIARVAHYFKVILITGARQVGKSTLLRNLFPDIPHIVFDRLSDESGARANPSLFLR